MWMIMGEGRASRGSPATADGDVWRGQALDKAPHAVLALQPLFCLRLLGSWLTDSRFEFWNGTLWGGFILILTGPIDVSVYRFKEVNNEANAKGKIICLKANGLAKTGHLKTPPS